jgi:translation initiation factor 1A
MGGKKLTKKKQQKISQTGETKRPLVLKEPGTEYGQAQKMLGNGRLEVVCFDGKTRLCHIRGKMLKRVWVSVGDILLIGLRDFQDDKADVIHKYSLDEAKKLKAMNEIPGDTKFTTEVKFNDDDDEKIDIVFDEI